MQNGEINYWELRQRPLTRKYRSQNHMYMNLLPLPFQVTSSDNSALDPIINGIASVVNKGSYELLEMNAMYYLNLIPCADMVKNPWVEAQANWDPYPI